MPSARATRSAATLSTDRPYPRAREPQALLPSIPPIVQRVCVDGSGPKRRPWARASRWSAACTTPGCTRAVRGSASIATTWLSQRLVSTTMPGPTALPAIEVPAPRMVSGVPVSRAVASVASTSSASCGRTTTCGGIR